jgi:hypothetical protein
MTVASSELRSRQQPAHRSALRVNRARRTLLLQKEVMMSDARQEARQLGQEPRHLRRAAWQRNVKAASCQDQQAQAKKRKRSK